MRLLFCNECSGIGQSFGSDVGTTEHTGNFVKTLIGRELLDVGDGDDLQVSGEFLHDAAHSVGNVTRDTRVDFVEDDGWQGACRGHQTLDAKHETADFAARSHFASRSEWLIFIRREKEFDGVGASLISLVGRGLV